MRIEFRHLQAEQSALKPITLQSLLKDHPAVISGSQIGSVIIVTESKILIIGAPSAFHRMELELALPVERYTFGQVNREIARGKLYLEKWKKIARKIIEEARLISGHAFGQSRDVLFLDRTQYSE